MLCTQEAESFSHLFIHCTIDLMLWFKIIREADIHRVITKSASQCSLTTVAHREVRDTVSYGDAIHQFGLARLKKIKESQMKLRMRIWS